MAAPLQQQACGSCGAIGTPHPITHGWDAAAANAYLIGLGLDLLLHAPLEELLLLDLTLRLYGRPRSGGKEGKANPLGASTI